MNDHQDQRLCNHEGPQKEKERTAYQQHQHQNKLTQNWDHQPVCIGRGTTETVPAAKHRIIPRSCP